MIVKSEPVDCGCLSWRLWSSIAAIERLVRKTERSSKSYTVRLESVDSNRVEIWRRTLARARAGGGDADDDAAACSWRHSPSRAVSASRRCSAAAITAPSASAAPVSDAGWQKLKLLLARSLGLGARSRELGDSPGQQFRGRSKQLYKADTMKPTMAKLVAKLTAAREADNAARVNKLLVRVAKRAKYVHREQRAAGGGAEKMGSLLTKLKDARKQSDASRVDELLLRVAKRARLELREAAEAAAAAAAADEEPAAAAEPEVEDETVELAGKLLDELGEGLLELSFKQFLKQLTARSGRDLGGQWKRSIRKLVVGRANYLQAASAALAADAGSELGVDSDSGSGSDSGGSDPGSDSGSDSGSGTSSSSESEDEVVVAAAEGGAAATIAPTTTRKRKREQSSVEGGQSEDGDSGGGSGGAPAAASEAVFISPLRSRYVGVMKHGNRYA